MTVAVCILSGVSLLTAVVNFGAQVYLQADARDLWYSCVPLPRIVQLSGSEVAAGCLSVVQLVLAAAMFVLSMTLVCR
jgi:hypothetical protein